MSKKRRRPYKNTKTKFNRILQAKYDILKAKNPGLSEAELDKLFIEQHRAHRRKKAAKREKSDIKKRANSRKRVAKKSNRGSTGKSVWTVQGGGVSPR